MSGFALHPSAAEDLAEIWEFIATGSLDAADRVLEDIYQSIQSLSSFPHLGHVRPDLTSRPLRFHTVRDFLISYVPEEQPLLVLAILHGRRSPRVLAAILRGR